MFTTQKPQHVKFFCGLIYADELAYKKTIDILKKKYGVMDFESGPICFNFTDYYNDEMGTGLNRRFIAFKRLQAADNFISIKRYCINIEKKFSLHGKRTINIDPGYINEAKLILTTTKDFSHRIYLGRGVFAEITLIYHKGGFKDLDWTFPDYRTLQYKRLFASMRDIYRKTLRNE